MDVRCVFSGVQAGRARTDVAVVLSKRLSRCLKEWKCDNERNLRIRFNVEDMRLTVIRMYAPTEDSNWEVKAVFARLQEAVGSVARGDVLMVIRELNARVGNDSEVWWRDPRKTWRSINGNGRQLLQLCNKNSLAVSNSWFQHK